MDNKEQAKELLEAIAVCAALTQTQMPEAAARAMAEDLARYPHFHVLGALTRCRRELRGRMTLADVIERLDDGRPGPQEAWAIVAPTFANEGPTVVWTDEMAEAMGVAQKCGDVVAARMAFLESYRTLCQRSRDAGAPAHWTPSLGWDKNGRDGPLLDAVAAGKLPAAHIEQFLIGDTARADLLRLAPPDQAKKAVLDAMIRDRPEGEGGVTA
jgi:bacterioferritin-associated ferredoxin